MKKYKIGKYLLTILLSAFFFLALQIGVDKNNAIAGDCLWGYRSTENCTWKWQCMTTKLCDCTLITNAKEGGDNDPCIENPE